LVLDSEIAVPDERGVTRIDLLSEKLRQRRPDQLAYLAFDLLYLDGHDLRGCAIEDRRPCCAMSSAPPVASGSSWSTTWWVLAGSCSRQCARSAPKASSRIAPAAVIVAARAATG
jgi:hypothetical protein